MLDRDALNLDRSCTTSHAFLWLALTENPIIRYDLDPRDFEISIKQLPEGENPETYLIQGRIPKNLDVFYGLRFAIPVQKLAIWIENDQDSSRKVAIVRESEYTKVRKVEFGRIPIVYSDEHPLVITFSYECRLESNLTIEDLRAYRIFHPVIMVGTATQERRKGLAQEIAEAIDGGQKLWTNYHIVYEGHGGSVGHRETDLTGLFSPSAVSAVDNV